MTRLHDLYERGGQSPWLDNLKRSYLTSGRLADLVSSGVRGLTSNPTIMAKAIAASSDYDEQFSAVLDAGPVASRRPTGTSYLPTSSAPSACCARVYDDSDGGDGFVSIEVSPRLAHDTAGTTESARRPARAHRPAQPVREDPCHRGGLPAIQAHDRRGPEHQCHLDLLPRALRSEVIEAYLSGLGGARAEGGELSKVASVASFFVSRVDTEVDRRLEQIAKEEAGSPTATLALALRGKAAVAQARLAYRLYLELFAGPTLGRAREGRRRAAQRPLWASTSTKNPAYPDLVYVDTLVGPQHGQHDARGDARALPRPRRPRS